MIVTEKVNYDLEIINTSECTKVIKDVTCAICLNLLIEAQMCCACETNFCRECINSWINSNNVCPVCKEIPLVIKPISKAQKILMSLVIVKCINNCEVTLYDFPEHIKQCHIKHLKNQLKKLKLKYHKYYNTLFFLENEGKDSRLKNIILKLDQEDKLNIDTNIIDFEVLYNENNLTIIDLQNMITDLKNELSKEQTKYSKLKDENEDLEGQMWELNEEIDELKQNHHNEMKILQEQHITHLKKYKQEEKRLLELVEENNNLKAKLNRVKPERVTSVTVSKKSSPLKLSSKSTPEQLIKFNDPFIKDFKSHSELITFNSLINPFSNENLVNSANILNVVNINANKLNMGNCNDNQINQENQINSVFKNNPFIKNLNTGNCDLSKYEKIVTELSGSSLKKLQLDYINHQSELNKVDEEAVEINKHKENLKNLISLPFSQEDIILNNLINSNEDITKNNKEVVVVKALALSKSEKDLISSWLPKRLHPLNTSQPLNSLNVNLIYSVNRNNYSIKLLHSICKNYKDLVFIFNDRQEEHDANSNYNNLRIGFYTHELARTWHNGFLGKMAESPFIFSLGMKTKFIENNKLNSLVYKDTGPNSITFISDASGDMKNLDCVCRTKNNYCTCFNLNESFQIDLCLRSFEPFLGSQRYFTEYKILTLNIEYLEIYTIIQ